MDKKNWPSFIKLNENKLSFEPKKKNEGTYKVEIKLETTIEYPEEKFVLSVYGNVIINTGNVTEKVETTTVI